MFRYAAVRWAMAVAGGLAFAWAMPEASAATWYWDTTTTGLWSDGANWSDNPTSGGTTGTVPTDDTTTDIAYFNQSSVNGTQTVQLNADRAITGIVVANTGATTIASSNATPRLLTLGANGLTMLSAANNLTLGGASNPLNLTIAVSQTFANNASSRTLTVVGGISRTAGDTTARTLTIDSAGSTAIQGVVSDGGASGSLGLTKSGTGQLTLSAANTYTGATIVNSGTLRLEFPATGAPASNIINNVSNSSGLTLSGGALSAVGKASTSNSQQFNGLTLNRGPSAITATIGASGTVNLSMGAITRSVAGSSLNLTLPTAGGITTTTANANFSGGQQTILGGYATVSGTTWAVSASDGTSPGAITGLASYSSSFSAAADVDVPVGTSSPSSLTVNSLRFSGTSASSVISTVNVTGSLTVATGGILVNDMGTTFRNHTISGGTLATGNGVDLVVIQNSSRAGNYLGITSKMTGGMGFTKSGAGEVRLTGANDYTGPTNVLAGGVLIGDNSNSGSLNPASDIFVSVGATFGVDRPTGGTATQGVQFGTISGEGGFRVARSGTVTMNAANTYSGPTTVSGAAALSVASIGSWSAGNTTASNLGSPNTAANGVLTLSTGVLRYTGAGETTNRDVRGTSGAATGTFTIDQAGTGNLVFTGTLRSDGSGSGSQVLQLQGSTAGTGEIAGVIEDKTPGSRFTAVTKAGTGTWRLSGTSNPYGGVTTVNGGVLEVASLANGGAISSTGTSSSAAANLVIDGGTLRYIGMGGSSDRNFTTGTNGGTIDASGAAALTLSGSSALLGTNTARTLTFTGSSAALNTFAGALGDNGSGATSVTKAGTGTWVFSGSSNYTGLTQVNAGQLRVNGQIASAVAVSANATLGGSGVIGGGLSGAGLVSPGNSPGILTATQFNPTGGLDAAFEFTNLSPVYNAPSASVNDVLRLTDAGNPFASGVFTSGNVIDVYFNVDTISSGQVYEGGFFTALSAASLLAALDGTATFNYWAKTAGTPARTFGGIDYVSLASLPGITGVTFQTAARTANFGSGDVSGSVTQFIIVPEPGGLLLAAIGAGLVAGALRARRLAIRGRIVRADHEASLARDAPGASP